MIIEELIQYDCTPKNIMNSLDFILETSNRKKIISGYSELISQLGDGGCFKNISNIIYSDLVRMKK